MIPECTSHQDCERFRRRRPAPYRTYTGSSAAAPQSHRLDAHDKRKYVVVVDAGSSGSRLMVYSWRNVGWDRHVRQVKGLPLDVLPRIEGGNGLHSGEPWQVKVEPGFSSFAGRTHEIRAYVDKLLAHAWQVVPPSALPHTPVYILATAGMRLLRPEDRQAILLETCRILREQPFHFGPDLNDYAGADTDTACGGHVRVISGEEEGLLGWMSVNYLMHDFGPHATTLGFLDMGGASTQIAFEPSVSTDSVRGLYNVTLRRLDSSVESHHVFVTTFLGFGTNAARTRYLYALSERLGGQMALPDPCLPKGLQLPTEDGRGTVYGTGSFRQCREGQLMLLDKQAACAQPPCPFHGVHVPLVDFHEKPFVGISEYWYSSDDVFRLGGPYDHDKFDAVATDFCASEWPTLESNLQKGVYPHQITLGRLQMQCFKAAWMSTILHEGFDFSRGPNSTAFQSLNDMRGLSVSWTLGKALLEASKDISTLEPLSTPASPVPSWVKWGFFVVVCVSLVLLWRKMRGKSVWMPVSSQDRDQDCGEEHGMVVTIPSALDEQGDKGTNVGLGRLSRTSSLTSIPSRRGSLSPTSVPSSRSSSAVRIVPRHFEAERSEQLANAGLPTLSPSASMLLMQADRPHSAVPKASVSPSPYFSSRSSERVRTYVRSTPPPPSISPRTPTLEEQKRLDEYVMSSSITLGRARSPAPAAGTPLASPGLVGTRDFRERVSPSL